MNSLKFNFLLCSERSGSNLITQMLNAHPKVCGPSPNHAIRAVAQNRWRYGELTKDENWQIFLNDLQQYLDAQLGLWSTDFSGSDFEKIPHRRAEAALRYIFEKEARSLGKSTLFIKETKVHQFFAFLPVAFPEAKYVFMVRDPRDMALSWKKSANHPGGIREGVDQWISDQSQYRQIAGYLMESGKVFSLRYEDLLTDSEAQLKELCNLLELDFTHEMLAFHTREETRKNAARIENWNNLDKPVLNSNFNKFLNEMSNEELRYIESRCGDLMTYFGYEKHTEGMLAGEIEECELRWKADMPELRNKAGEAEIRQKRMAAIERILSRNLK
jgi:hypothetical protein